MLIRLLIIYSFAFTFTYPIFLRRRPMKGILRGQYRLRQRPLCGPNPQPDEDCTPAMCAVIARSGRPKLNEQYETTCVPLDRPKVKNTMQKRTKRTRSTTTESTTVTDDENTSADITTSNEDFTKTSSTSAPYDDEKKTTTTAEEKFTTEVKCNGRALCKGLLQG